jgi:hypothetical protein
MGSPPSSRTLGGGGTVGSPSCRFDTENGGKRTPNGSQRIGVNRGFAIVELSRRETLSQLYFMELQNDYITQNNHPLINQS